MPTILNPYLSFRGTAREAMEFYRSVFGGIITLFTFKDLDAAADPSEENLVMHSQLDTPGGMTLMAQDSPSRANGRPHDDVMISLSGDDEGQLQTYWERLSEGGEIVTPLAEVPWSRAFGMLVDRFGVHWLINVDLPVQS